MSDIDIDFADRDRALVGLSGLPAALSKGGQRQRHPSGVYFQNVPVNPFDGMASLDHEELEELGYFKVDFLNNTIYKGVRDEAHLNDLLAREPMWEMLDDPQVVGMLAQVANHYPVVHAIRPRSVEDLAVVIAMIRPDKRHLIGRPRHEIDAEIWTTSGRGYAFKRSHAVAYAMSIVVQMNLLVEGALSDGPL